MYKYSKVQIKSSKCNFIPEEHNRSKTAHKYGSLRKKQEKNYQKSDQNADITHGATITSYLCSDLVFSFSSAFLWILANWYALRGFNSVTPLCGFFSFTSSCCCFISVTLRRCLFSVNVCCWCRWERGWTFCITLGFFCLLWSGYVRKKLVVM